jgi:hypothetical protein
MSAPQNLYGDSVESLIAIRTAILAAITEAYENRKPTYTDDAGRTVNWNEYRAGLFVDLESVETRIRRANTVNVPPAAVTYPTTWRDDQGRSPYVGSNNE